jgi:tetratricopeptide (TPR) repeat protein
VNPESKKRLANAIGLHKSKKFVEARLIYEHLELLFPTNATVLHLLGLLDFQQSNFQASIKRIDRAITLEPYIADYHLDKSNTLFQLGRLEEALSSCNDAIKLRESFEVAFYQRAIVLQKLNRYEEALVSLDNAIKFNSKFVEALHRRGGLLLKLNRPLQALKCLDNLIEFEPLLAQAHSDRGIALSNLHRLEESLTSYERAINIKPDLTIAYANMGALLKKIGYFDRALKCFLRCRELEPNEMPHLLRLAILYKKLGNAQLSNRYFEECAALKVRKSSDLLHLSVAQLNLGKWHEAFDVLRGWNSPPSHLHDGFESHGAWLGYLKQLSQLRINTAKNYVPGNSLMFAADLKYVEKFFHAAHKSILDKCPNLNTHLHVMIDSEKDAAKIDTYISRTVSVSYELYSPKDKVGYTTRRFMRLIQLLNHFKRPMLCLDIDSILLGDISSIWDDLKDADIALYLREEDIVIHQLVHASMLFAAPTKRSMAFLGFFTNYVAYLESRGESRWFADQVALVAAYEWAKRNPSKCTVKKIPNHVMSSSNINEGALLQTFKGQQKETLG